MEWLLIFIGLIVFFAILGRPKCNSRTEYHPPPDYEDDPPPPLGASQKAMDKWDKEHA